MQRAIKCPQCKAETRWSDNPHRPFCSERCRLIDLGQWADESYRIPGPLQEQISDENLVYLTEIDQDNER
jgi:endogenous inhibitor of DNA gyrase (YacG/DUF329 family)